MWLKGIGIFVLIGGLLGVSAFLGYGLGYNAGEASEGATAVVRHGWHGAGVFFNIFPLFFLFLLISKIFMFAGWRRHHAGGGRFGRRGWEGELQERHDRWHREADDEKGEPSGEGEKPPTA